MLELFLILVKLFNVTCSLNIVRSGAIVIKDWGGKLSRNRLKSCFLKPQGSRQLRMIDLLLGKICPN